MTLPPDSPKARNMAYLRLEFYEHEMFVELMETEMRYWPEGLARFVETRCNRQGLCGDVIAVAVADWIAHRP